MLDPGHSIVCNIEEDEEEVERMMILSRERMMTQKLGEKNAERMKE